MQSTDALPLQSWGEALAQSRIEQELSLAAIARELMLSMAQIRGIESGQTNAFHAESYYLRAVQKYADRLQVSLDPPVSSFLTAESAEAQRKKNVRATSMSQPYNSVQLPDSRTHGARLGRWLFLLLLILVASGVYMAINDGWPWRSMEESASTQDDTKTDEPPTSSSTSQRNTTKSTLVTTRSLDSGTSLDDKSQNQTNSQIASGSFAQTTASKSPTSVIGAVRQTPTPEPFNTTPRATPADTTLSSSLAPKPQMDASVPQREVPDDIVLSFADECWVELQRKDGPTEQKIYKPGETLRVAADQVQRLTIGNAQAAKAERAGKPLDVMQFTRGGNSVARIDAQALSTSAP